MDVVELSREFVKRIEELEANCHSSDELNKSLQVAADDLREQHRTLNETLRSENSKLLAALGTIERLKNDKLELLNRIEKFAAGKFRGNNQ